MAEERPKKGGRPPKQIDWKVFENLCQIQCTYAEIASVLGVAVSTVMDRASKEYEDKFSNVYKRFADSGKASLRRTQMKLAQKNATMAIWLGKQYLGQRDHEKEQDDQIHQFVKDLKAAVKRDAEGDDG